MAHKTGEKSRKATGERREDVDLNAGTKSDTKADEKAPNENRSNRRRSKKKADAPAAASKQPKKSQRIKEDTGQAQANKAP